VKMEEKVMWVIVRRNEKRTIYEELLRGLLAD
jgi:hypothetical protein